jgi:hypothetical protein
MFMDDEFPMILEREAGMSDNVPQVGVAFGNHFEQNGPKSTKAGHAVFDEVVFVKIAIPGDRNSLYFQPAQDSHKHRFPRAWEAYLKRADGGKMEGFPIEQWAAVSRAVAMTLKAAHIHTVEALAEVHDGHVDRIGIDGRGLRAKALAFITQARDNAAIHAAAERETALQAQLAAMAEQIKALAQQRGVPVPAMPALIPAPMETVGGQEPAQAARRPRGRAAAS